MHTIMKKKLINKEECSMKMVGSNQWWCQMQIMGALNE